MIRQRSKLGRGGRRLVMLCESLEGRVVLSGFGGGLGIAQAAGLVGSLSSAGVIVGPIGALSVGIGFDLNHGLNSGTDANIAQFKTDVQKLKADLTGIAAKSGVTIADIINLVSDSRAIASAGAKLDQTALTKAVTDLANAVAGGSDTTAARAEFNTLFTGTTVSQATIDKTFADLVQTITDSKVTSGDLSTLSADRIALQTDITAIQKNAQAPGGPHIGGSLNDALTRIGVILGNAGGYKDLTPFFPDAISTPNPALAQLRTDATKLKTDLTALGAKSGVTIADLSNLFTDTRTIDRAGVKVDPTALNKAVTDIVTAVAANADTTAARAEFNALFMGTSILQATIDKTYADIVQTVIDSKVTPTDINTITADRTAIQTDLTNLHQGQAASTGTGSGSGSGSGKGKTKTIDRTAHARVPTVSRRGHH